ncbi:MAG: DNA-formamidopyrimidine glycosylase family protein [Anaerolineales bacterium]
MPELPELEVVSEVLAHRLVGRVIQQVKVAPKGGAIVVRDLTGRGFAESLRGKEVRGVSRRGKFLLFDLTAGLWLAINPKLMGRFQLCSPDAKKPGPVLVILGFLDLEHELRYIDAKQMGQFYLTLDLMSIPSFREMGPDALAVSREEFEARIRRFRGEIKGVLTRADFVAGIGNAYADEILWTAGIHPYRKRSSLQAGQVAQVYEAMRTTLSGSLEKVRAEMGEDIHLEPRDFFSVHLRGGQPCPRCGTTISSITAHQRVTNFCRTCQPGGLVRGMN